MRIHHVSIPARDPARVAAALAEIFDARVVPLPHPRGTLLVYGGDSDGTAIEIWPSSLRLDAATQDLLPSDLPLPEAWPHHCFVTSDACTTETILAIFAREGWPAEHVHNGPPGAGFSLVRGRIEDHTSIELGGRDLRAEYEGFFRTIERGEHLVTARYGCTGCHGQDLAGGVMSDDPAIGDVRGPNLTRGSGGRTASYTMPDWDRIVRHGVKPDGTPAIMPSQDFVAMCDAELSDIAAYVRSVPAVDSAVAAPSFGPVGTVLLAVGKMPLSAEQTRSSAHPSAPPPAADSAEFGAHLAATCVTCHRQNLAGGPMAFGPPSWPSAGNLTRDAAGLRDWTYDDFERALTQGLRPWTRSKGRRSGPTCARCPQRRRIRRPHERPRAITTPASSTP